MKKFLVCIALIAVLTASQAFGEMTVSVTINGPIDEIAALLQHLKELGIGTASAPSKGKYDVTITSVGTSSTEVEQVGSDAPPPLALLEPKAQPETVKPGEKTLLTVKASDPNRVIDTIAATMDGAPGSTEFYDNGTNGDIAAGDGLWTAALTISPQAAEGEHNINIAAFGANGKPVTLPGENGENPPLAVPLKIIVKP